MDRRFRRADIGVIVLDPVLLNDPSYRDDPQFQRFVTGKQAGEFTFFDVPDLPVRIAVRKDLLTPFADRVSVSRN